MINVKSIAPILLLTVLVLAGCTGDGSSSVNTARGLTAADFNVAATRTLSMYKFEDDLNSNSFFTGFGEDTSSSSQLDPCFVNKLAGFTYTRIGENTFRMSVNDVDLTDCVQPYGDWSPELQVISLYIDSLIGKDDNGNIVDLEGIHYFDVPDYLPLQYRFKSYSLTRWRNTSTNELLEYRSIGALHDAASLNTPCTMDGIIDGCRYELVFEFGGNYSLIENYIDKTVIETHNLEIVDRAPYFQNGTMTFTFNDWSGTMTYGNDAYIPPTYTATNGVDTVSGIYTPPPAPALFRPFSGVPIMPFQRAD